MAFVFQLNVIAEGILFELLIQSKKCILRDKKALGSRLKFLGVGIWPQVCYLKASASAKKVEFLPGFVCLSLSDVTQKAMDGFWWNFQEIFALEQGRSESV